MKAICISACQVDRLGIVTEGEEVELPDSYAKDPRIQTHFSIIKSTIRNAEEKSLPFEDELNTRKAKFEKALHDHSNFMKAVDRLVDDGFRVPDELTEGGTSYKNAIDDDKRIEKLVEIWVEAYGWTFPTDEPKKAKIKGDGEEAKAKGKPGKVKEDKKSVEEEQDELFER